MRLLSARGVANKTSFSVPHIRRLSKQGKFPPPVTISQSRQAWLEEDIDAWINDCISSNRDGGC